MVDLELYKKRKKELHLTFEQLSDISGVPLQTLHNFFRGHTAHPRIDTMQSIERALGINIDISAPSENEKAAPALTDKEERLIKAFNVLIPPMQDYILEMTENLVQKQNAQAGTATGAGKKHA